MLIVLFSLCSAEDRPSEMTEKIEALTAAFLVVARENPDAKPGEAKPFQVKVEPEKKKAPPLPKWSHLHPLAVMPEPR